MCFLIVIQFWIKHEMFMIVTLTFFFQQMVLKSRRSFYEPASKRKRKMRHLPTFSSVHQKQKIFHLFPAQ